MLTYHNPTTRQQHSIYPVFIRNSLEHAIEKRSDDNIKKTHLESSIERIHEKR